MRQIVRSKGTTDSERYLARLADRTFLNLWSYPNVYRDEVVNGRQVGREICDLLVVCGDHVIIFSDKNVKLSLSQEVNTTWPRWYKRAIQKGVSQLNGAENWIIKHPKRIFLNASCNQTLPVDIPPASVRTIHKVLIAHGAAEACSRFFNGDSGSFMLFPSLRGYGHIDQTSEHYQPFCIGDIDPAGSFIHVFNDTVLDDVVRELGQRLFDI
jgi:hypothetical protein